MNGVKLRAEHILNGNTPITDYCGNDSVERIDLDVRDWIQDRFGSFLWDATATNQESTCNGGITLGQKRHRIQTVIVF